MTKIASTPLPNTRYRDLEVNDISPESVKTQDSVKTHSSRASKIIVGTPFDNCEDFDFFIDLSDSETEQDDTINNWNNFSNQQISSSSRITQNVGLSSCANSRDLTLNNVHLHELGKASLLQNFTNKSSSQLLPTTQNVSTLPDSVARARNTLAVPVVNAKRSREQNRSACNVQDLLEASEIVDCSHKKLKKL